MNITSKRLSESQIEEDLNKISSYKRKNERLAFIRKRKKLEGLVDKLKPIEDKVLEIYTNERNPVMEEIQALRSVMIKDCVHPKDMLVHKGVYVECKFCQSKLLLKRDEENS